MKKHIVCFGDSNTHGYCAMNDGRFDENERWTCLLQKSLGEDYLILEEGLSGLDYLYPCLMSHEPVDLLVIMLGTNDTKERFSAGAPAIGLGMIRLVKKAIATTDCWRDGKPQILIVTPQNIGKEYENSNVAGTMGNGCAEKSRGLAAEYERIAGQFGCYYLDANEVVKAAPNDIDHMHLTAQGHKELAVALDKKIREIFEK